MNDNDDLHDTGLRLWTRWMAMWNGRPELARELVAPRFALHLPFPARVDPASITDPEAVVRWVTAHRAQYDRLEFFYEAGPFVDIHAGVVAGPWTAEAIVKGTPRRVCGMDTIAFAAGRITEYWTLAKEVEDVGLWNRQLARVRE